MKQILRRVPRAFGALALFTGLWGVAAAAIADEQCDVRLTVELTSDAPDASDDGFLNSLLNNHAAYRLKLLREHDGSIVELDLTGPGPASRCESVIETMHEDARVLSIRVDSISQVAAAITPASIPGSESPAGDRPEGALDALSWGVHHPRQAWRILLPIESSDAAAATAPRLQYSWPARSSDGLGSLCDRYRPVC